MYIHKIETIPIIGGHKVIWPKFYRKRKKKKKKVYFAATFSLQVI